MTMTSNATAIPNHIGFIMDGNRRWAKSQGLPSLEGYRVGYEVARQLAEACFARGVQFVSLYAFSTENWQRKSPEISYLMKLLLQAVSAKEIAYALKRGTRMRFVGRRNMINPHLAAAMERAEEATKDQRVGTLIFCIDYGGHQEIADACKQCLQEGLAADDITPDAIASRLYSPDIPPLDVMVRTSGELRLSNFMLWRAAYSEFIFLQKHWPDMTKRDVTDIIKTYAARSRRFGG